MFIKSNGTRRQTFKHIWSGLGLLAKKLSQDIITRWNSTYNMLSKTIPCKQVLYGGRFW